MKKKGIIALLIFVSAFGIFYLLRSKPVEKPLTNFYNEGPIFGSTYHIKYRHTADLQPQIDSILKAYNESVSPYLLNSIVSRINNNDSTVITNRWVEDLFNEGMEVASVTDGAFDITIAPLVEAWGFSFKKKTEMTPQLVKNLKALVDYRKVKLLNHKIIKEDSRMRIDLISMGDGYATDIIANFLESKGIDNYMVEIGGEIKLKGTNQTNETWSVGIDKPVDQTDSTETELEQVVSFTNGALSTSGNYRNFYYKDGKKYAHTIDPKTGYPVQHSLLSATIIAPTCIAADAYSTACMIIGLEKSLELLKKDRSLEGYFIYTNTNGEMVVAYTDGFKKFLKE